MLPFSQVPKLDPELSHVSRFPGLCKKTSGIWGTSVAKVHVIGRWGWKTLPQATSPLANSWVASGGGGCV